MLSTPRRNEVGSSYKSFSDEFRRLDCPITLNPLECTFDDVALHATLRQRLSPSTVEKRLQYENSWKNIQCL